MKYFLKISLSLIAAAIVYLAFWPVPVDPQAWQAPTPPKHIPNQRLAAAELIDLHGHSGPEALTLDQAGYLYLSTHDGWILRSDHSTRNPQASLSFSEWANTGGRPLGLATDATNRIIVADAYRGLLAIDQQRQIHTLSTAADDLPIRYADDVAVATDGLIYFSDASTKFGAEQYGGTYPASLLDLMEHGGHGRLLVYNPATGNTRTLISGLNFANGVAMDPNQQFVLINETGHYRVWRLWLAGERAGEQEIFADNLPGFPDNIVTGRDGRFWIGLASPRNAQLDQLADKPWLRKIVQRLPAALRPQAQPYGYLIAIDSNGKIIQDLQDPSGRYPVVTGALETEHQLFISSLMADHLAVLPINTALNNQ